MTISKYGKDELAKVCADREKIDKYLRKLRGVQQEIVDDLPGNGRDEEYNIELLGMIDSTINLQKEVNLMINTIIAKFYREDTK